MTAAGFSCPATTRSFSSFTSVLTERATGRTMPVLPTFNRSRVADISDDSRYLLLTGAPLAGTHFGLYMLDRDTGVVTEVEPPSRDRFVGSSALISGDGRTAAYHVSSPTQARPRCSVVPHIAAVNADADADGLTDAWETTFGLDPLDPADASLDQDGDGATAAQEFAASVAPSRTGGTTFCRRRRWHLLFDERRPLQSIGYVGAGQRALPRPERRERGDTRMDARAVARVPRRQTAWAWPSPSSRSSWKARCRSPSSAA